MKGSAPAIAERAYEPEILRMVANVVCLARAISDRGGAQNRPERVGQLLELATDLRKAPR